MQVGRKPVPISDPDLELPDPPQKRRPDWPRAWRALQQLLDDGDDTAKAFEVVHALDADRGEGIFRRFLSEPGARELLATRPSLLDALDFGKLAGLPDGSFGRAALDHFQRNDLDPRGLVALHRESIASDPPLDSARSWFRERFVLTHDLWHVLSGYGSDGLGEAALLWFSTAQTHARSGMLLSLGAGFSSWKQVGRAWPGYVIRAWRRGQRAVGLFSLAYEKLLPEPLHLVRGGAGIAPPAIAHPRGILRISEAGEVQRISPNLSPRAA